MKVTPSQLVEMATRAVEHEAKADSYEHCAEQLNHILAVDADLEAAKRDIAYRFEEMKKRVVLVHSMYVDLTDQNRRLSERDVDL